MKYQVGDKILISKGAYLFWNLLQEKCIKLSFNAIGEFCRYWNLDLKQIDELKGRRRRGIEFELIEPSLPNLPNNTVACPLDKISKYSELEEKIDRELVEENEIEYNRL